MSPRRSSLRMHAGALTLLVGVAIVAASLAYLFPSPAAAGATAAPWPGPYPAASLPSIELRRAMIRDLYRLSSNTVSTGRYEPRGVVTIVGKPYRLMLAKCAIPDYAIEAGSGGYIQVPGHGQAIVSVSSVGSRRFISVDLSDGRSFFGASPDGEAGALHGTLNESDAQTLLYKRRAEALLGPYYDWKLKTMPSAKGNALRTQLNAYSRNAAPSWTWSVELTCD